MNHHIPSTHDERLAGLEARMAAVEFREIEDREALRHHKEHTFAPLAGKLDDLRTKVYIGIGIGMAINVMVSKVFDVLR
jgi:hypothetical protein